LGGGSSIARANAGTDAVTDADTSIFTIRVIVFVFVIVRVVIIIFGSIVIGSDVAADSSYGDAAFGIRRNLWRQRVAAVPDRH
jgi:hypothetical protein